MNALTAGDSISPSGVGRIDGKMPMGPVDSLLKKLKDLETIPIRVEEVTSVSIRQLATVSDPSDLLTGSVLVNGRCPVYTW